MPNFTDPELGMVYDKVVEIGDALISHIGRYETRHDDLTARINSAEVAIASKEAANGTGRILVDEMREQHASCFTAMAALREPGIVDRVLRTTETASGLGRWAAGIVAAVLASLIVAGMSYIIHQQMMAKAIEEVSTQAITKAMSKLPQVPSP